VPVCVPVCVPVPVPDFPLLGLYDVSVNECIAQALMVDEVDCMDEVDKIASSPFLSISSIPVPSTTPLSALCDPVVKILILSYLQYDCKKKRTFLTFGYIQRIGAPMGRDFYE
jgi:hypothetical protein